MVMNSEIHNKGEVSILTNIVLILLGSSPTEVDVCLTLVIELNRTVQLAIVQHIEKSVMDQAL